MAPGQAAVAAKLPPNPCATFTVASADTLFGIGTHTRLAEKLTEMKRPDLIRYCTIKHAGLKLTVGTQFRPGAFGNSRCYRRPRLGAKGYVCLSGIRAIHFTFSVFRKDKVYVSAYVNEQLADQGAAIYTFALAQYARFKG